MCKGIIPPALSSSQHAKPNGANSITVGISVHPLEPFNPEYDSKEPAGCDSKISAVKHIHTVVYLARIPNSKHMQYVFSYQGSVGIDQRISEEIRGWRG